MKGTLDLLQFENEDAIDILADIMEPVASILADKQFEQEYKQKKPTILLVKYILKNHKKEIVEIISTLHGETPETYKFNVITLTKDLLMLLNEPALKEVFTLQGQNET